MSEVKHVALPQTTLQEAIDILQKLPYGEVADLLHRIVKEHQTVTIKQAEKVVDEVPSETENK